MRPTWPATFEKGEYRETTPTEFAKAKAYLKRVEDAGRIRAAKKELGRYSRLTELENWNDSMRWYCLSGEICNK